MITDITIQNFKSIQKITNLELKPLTILTGVNSSGKSNIMEAIFFFGQGVRLQQSQQGSTISYRHIFNQGEIHYPRFLENFVVFKKNSDLIINLEINIEIDKHEKNKIMSLLSKYSILDPIYKKVRYEDIHSIGYSYAFTVTNSFFTQKILINKEKIFEVSQTDNQPPKLVYPEYDANLTQSTGSFLNENVFKAQRGPPPIKEVLDIVSPEIIKLLRDKLRKIYLISGERGTIYSEKRVSDRIETPIIWVGYKSDNLIEILSDCFTRNLKKSRDIVEWASKFQLNDVRAGYTVINILESNFKDNLLDIDLNSSLAGLGSRQLLSIITQIFYSNSGDIIMIEEPEISLHPENQVLLHELFAKAISQGKQIICSTHSPFFVLSLSRAIKKKLLKTENVAIFQVEKDENGTKVNKLFLNKNGFIEGGVPSFMKVELDLFKDWSESLDKDYEEQ